MTTSRLRLSGICGSLTAMVLLGSPLTADSASTARTAEEQGPIYTSYDPPGGFHPALEFGAAPAGRYVLDPEHAHLTFQMLHYGGLSRPQFRFRDIQAEYQWDPAHPEATKIVARVSPTSIDANSQDFSVRMNAPEVLRGYDPSENGKYRYITFKSTAITFSGKDGSGHHIGTMTGNLTFLGVTKPITVNLTYNGFLGNRLGARKMGYSANTTFKRTDFGMSLSSVPSAGDEVVVTMEFEFMLVESKDRPFPSW